METIIKELEVYKEMLTKYEKYKKKNVKNSAKWANNNREKYNEWQREYYRTHFKDNKEYLKKKCQSVLENERKKIIADPNYLEEKRTKSRERARLQAKLKREKLLAL